MPVMLYIQHSRADLHPIVTPHDKVLARIEEEFSNSSQVLFFTLQVFFRIYLVELVILKCPIMLSSHGHPG